MENDKLFKKTLRNKKLSKIDENIENILIESLIDALKLQQTHNLGNLGYLKKNSKNGNDGRITKKIDFIQNEDENIKILEKIKKNKDIVSKSEKNKNILLIISVAVIVLFILGGVLLFLSFFLKNSKTKFNDESNSIVEKLISDKTKNDFQTKKEGNKDSSSDFVIYKNKRIMKEEIDYKNKEIIVNNDKSIIIKTEAKNDTNLKEGEFTIEKVSIDGKIYDKNLYVIKKGDTLWDIAKKFLKNPFLWPNIHKDNPYIKNPHKIQPNYKLTIYTIED
ncbi:MAG TPA: LysM peptidoglycan-binding domain-containing protein [Spirochaetota bacterium]|nr:LysM peptidoglycan-binding domain-containing protein [Spirochaetota bacterium]